LLTLQPAQITTHRDRSPLPPPITGNSQSDPGLDKGLSTGIAFPLFVEKLTVSFFSMFAPVVKSGFKMISVALLLGCVGLPLLAQGKRAPWPAEKVNTVVDGKIKEGVQVLQVDEEPMISLRTIKKIFGGRVQWKRVSRRVVYHSQGQRAEFGLDLSTAVVAGKNILMTPAVRAWGDEVYLPASLLITPEFQNLVASVVQWDPARRNLTVDPSPEVSSPRFYSYPSSARVSVDIGPHVNYHVLAKRQEAITIRLYGGRAKEWEKISINDGAIQAVEVAPRSRTTDLIITVASGTADPSIYLEESPRTLVIEVARENGPFSPTPIPVQKHLPRPQPLSPPSTTETVLAPPARARPRSDIDAPYLALSPLRTIVIDAGHGGKDAGAVGPHGTLEKEANLQIALALAKVLNNEGRFKVILTRTDDRFLTLQERSSIANKAKADLFISLHCNAGLKSDAHGFEVFFLSEKASDDDAAAVARRENAVVELEGIAGKARHELEGLLWSLARNEHMNDSSAIAGHITLQVAQRLSMLNRGVKQAGFYVLRGTSMPAILVESAFITHPKEEGLLRSARFHQKLADALYAGLLDYEKKRIQSRLVNTKGNRGG
jgi:N-acetylmuramoyl-L-alanine amidase